jgi:hypothetical protein
MNQDQAVAPVIEAQEAPEVSAPISYDLDAILAAPEKPITHKVGVIFNEDGEPISGFYIVGRNSDEHRKVDKALKIVNQQAAAARSKAIDQKTQAGAEKVITVIDAQNVARAAAVTVGWFGWDKKGDDGKPVARPFDASLMPAILKQKPTWVEKIQFALFEDNNFLPVLPSTSAPMPDSN